MAKASGDWVVLKFGGTSVSSLENWQNIANVVKQRKDQQLKVCVVHSALSGVSNLLQAIIDDTDGEKSTDIVDEIKKKHSELGKALGVDAGEVLAEYFEELDHLVKGISLIGETSYRVQARLMSLGELMSTTLGASYLQKKGVKTEWMDARELLQSIPQQNVSEKSLILSAVCDTKEDEELRRHLEEKPGIVLTQGFIARDAAGQTVLLGRGGSDVSAAYFAAKLGAERLEIWTDVPGMFSANPQEIPSARLLKNLSYEEAQEIATNGAKVLHPRSIMPARIHSIPVHIKYTRRPELEGTVIGPDTDDDALVKAIAVRQDITLVSMDSLGMWQQVGFLADAFAVFKKHGLSIDLVSTSDSNVTVSLDPGANTHFNDVREAFIDDLSAMCRVRIIESAAAVSLLGRNIRNILHQLGPAFEVFQEHHVYLVTQAANDLNFTFVVTADQSDRLVRQLHELVISHSYSPTSFGSTWQEIVGKKTVTRDGQPVWWRQKKEQLLALAEKQAPVYVYDTETIQRTIQKVQRMESLDSIFYAVKANNNEEVLEYFHDAGLGFECVSIGEVEYVFALFPDIDPKKILFTPNFAPRTEYRQALDLGIHLTLDNIFPLREWPELFRDRELFLRIDPGQGYGHHEHVRTGGIHSKFGIPQFELQEAAQIIEKIDARVKGLHAHLGSGIKDPGSWKQTAITLADLANRFFEDVEILDVGGGFGIRENERQPVLDLDEVDRSLMEFKNAYPQFQLWAEPGRYFIATAGVLLTRVTQLKGKGAVRYVGVDTGMNSLIRPALYGSHHTIVNLSKLDSQARQTVNVVGPICETGDKLGIDRLFPESEEGDVILIANTGAYGKVMSSSYNLRPPAAEVVIYAT